MSVRKSSRCCDSTDVGALVTPRVEASSSPARCSSTQDSVGINTCSTIERPITVALPLVRRPSTHDSGMNR